ncbi:MAG TPA: hypothetical protein VHE81_19305 [Lacipirellulaceae bacterium]|nr:hypothetical protein [Lacipirellulaceae bacterium]
MLFGAMSWSRQRDMEMFATRRRLEATLSNIIGQGRASVGSSTLIIVKRSTFNDNDLARIVDLQRQLAKTGSPIYFIALEGTKVNDVGINRLAEIDSLEHCFLGQTTISDVSMKALEKLPKLKTLDVHATRVTNQALLRLSKSRPGINLMPRPNPRPKNAP